MSSFGERLVSAVLARESQLVLGLDPDPMRLWPRAIELAGERAEPPAGPDARAAWAVALHCSLVLDAVAEECVAVKLQVACFERLGAAGWAALREVVIRAREHGLLVIADAKRSDIDVTATAYAHAFFGGTPTPFGAVPGLMVDALTVNPLLGTEAVAPMLAGARETGGGVFVLVRTSNPGAAEIQDLALAGGGSVSDRLAKLVAELGRPGIGAAGVSDVGAVVGATAGGTSRLADLRAAMPAAPLLLPGVGAQGGRVDDLAAAFSIGPAGGLIAASRSIVAAHTSAGGDPAGAARAEAARLRAVAWSLAP